MKKIIALITLLCLLCLEGCYGNSQEPQESNVQLVTLEDSVHYYEDGM